MASDNFVVPQIVKMPTMSKIKDIVDEDDGINSYSEKNKSSVLSSFYLTFCLSFLLISYFIFLYFYNSFNANEYLRIGDIKVDCASEKNIILKYKIFNDADAKVMLPKVRIRLKDRNNTNIKTHILHDKIDIKPASYVNIKTELSATEKADKVDISIGGDINFLVW